MSLKENISAAINSDINAQISSDAATNISEEVNSHISLKTLSLKEGGEIVKVNNITYSTVHDNISMYNNFVADDYYASKSWVLSKNYLTKEDIGDIDITNNIEELLNNKADKNHNHDDRYYTKDNLDTWQTNLDLAFMDINDRLNNKADWDALYSKIDIAELDSFRSEINTTIDNFSAELSTKASIYDLDNLVNFSTFNELNSYVYDSCATKDEIPTKVSELANDKAYVTTADLTKINELIPNAASSNNQLADKNFVNSSITTATADFRGTVESIEELNNLQGNLNDYAFYKHTDESGNTLFDRYKYTDKWEYEYTLNNSSFTSDQWEAINSGVTANIVNNIPSKISDLINDSNFATTDSIPTKTSELINDNNFITVEEAPNGVLSCKYGVTTYQEIENAVLAGKMPIVYADQTSTIRRFYRYNTTYSNKHIFISVYDGSVENRAVYVNSDNVWSTASVTNLIGSAPEWMITARNNPSWGISTKNYDSAVRHALCDADGSTSYNPAYTNEQKSAARNKIGAVGTDTLNNYVDLSSDQTIAGKKVFSTKPVYEEHIVITDHNLPDEYQEVEYIQSGGTQYIDTGINPKIKPRVVVNMMLLNSADKDYWGNNNIDGSAYLANFASGILMYYRYGRTGSINTGVSAPFNEFHEWDVSDAIYLDKVKLHTTPNVYTYNADQSNIYLFRSARSYGIFRASYFIIYDGDEKVREYYPCYRKSDNAIGLFDKVSNTFFPNLGSGVFIKGNDIISGDTVFERELISNADITAYLKNISNYDANKTQVLKNVNGIFKWVDE